MAKPIKPVRTALTLADVMAPKATQKASVPADLAPAGAAATTPDAAGRSGRKHRATTVAFPDHVRQAIHTWLQAHPEHTQRTLLMKGLREIGFDCITDADLTPERSRQFIP